MAPMGERIRLQKALSRAGLMSRRRAEELIAAGRVTINGRRAILGDRVDPDIDRVEIEGVPLPLAPDLVTYLVYKPVGVISTTTDPRGRPTVVDLVPAEPRVWPVGRLDADSEGLILLTNDGELTNRVTHPRYGITKTYVALVEGAVSRRVLRRLEEGVELEDGIARALRARLLERSADRSLLELVMGEGRNREVRRMAEAVGYPVRRLVRTAIGPLRDPNLQPGAHRRLTPQEITALYRASVGGD